MKTPAAEKPLRMVLSNSYGTANVGDQAILESMLHSLANRFSGIEIDLLSMHVEQSCRRHPQINSLYSGPLKGFFATCRSIRRADLLVLGGGGIIQDASSFGNLVFHLSRPVIAYLVGTPFIGAGLGVGPIKRSFGRWLTKRCLNCADALLVRDKYSAAILGELNVDRPPIIVTADFALALDFPNRPELKQPYRDLLRIKNQCDCLIGLSLRPERGRHKTGARQSEAFGHQLNAWVEVANSMVRQRNAHIVFVSMHPDQDDSLGWEIARRMHQPERFTLLSGGLDPQTMMATVGLLDLLIGMRLHSIVFAARSAVPFIAIAYDAKVTAFCELLGQGEQVLSPDRMLDYDSLMAKIERTWQRRKDIASAIKKELPQLVLRAQSNIDAIATHLKEARK